LLPTTVFVFLIVIFAASQERSGMQGGYRRGSGHTTFRSTRLSAILDDLLLAPTMISSKQVQPPMRRFRQPATF
jgi:hypothetical protein